ncbi:uncharacterized protein LOC126832737 [Adelges cooleyi]|uniref:uncharacterized protein LOC126832737 n=1 Tax=Adelges cooleyi TaxID=133065 RepID=UPI00217F693E|nr:uncharacterized protein LOC126832737 [Adelges cooleyi]
MASNSNTSQFGFVKTYGKPRRTQLLSQTALWHDDLADDFDKCLGIQDAQQTTFISPEPMGSVTMYKPKKHQKENRDKMKTINGWSMRLQSTSFVPKGQSTAKKKKIQNSFKLGSSYFRKIKLPGSAEKKKRPHTDMSSPYLKSGGIMGTPTSHTKLKKKLCVSKTQCSTPLQNSTKFFDKNCSKSMFSNKKPKKKIQNNNFGVPNDATSTPVLLKIQETIRSNNSNVFPVHSSCKIIPLDESIKISGCHSLFKSDKPSVDLKTNSDLSFGTTISDSVDDCVLPKSSKLFDKKKKTVLSHSTKGKLTSDWYGKVYNTLCDEVIDKANEFKDIQNSSILTELSTSSTESNATVITSELISGAKIEKNCIIDENFTSPQYEQSDKNISIEEGHSLVKINQDDTDECKIVVNDNISSQKFNSGKSQMTIKDSVSDDSSKSNIDVTVVDRLNNIAQLMPTENISSDSSLSEYNISINNSLEDECKEVQLCNKQSLNKLCTTIELSSSYSTLSSSFDGLKVSPNTPEDSSDSIICMSSNTDFNVSVNAIKNIYENNHNSEGPTTPIVTNALLKCGKSQVDAEQNHSPKNISYEKNNKSISTINISDSYSQSSFSSEQNTIISGVGVSERRLESQVQCYTLPFSETNNSPKVLNEFAMESSSLNTNEVCADEVVLSCFAQDEKSESPLNISENLFDSSYNSYNFEFNKENQDVEDDQNKIVNDNECKLNLRRSSRLFNKFTYENDFQRCSTSSVIHSEKPLINDKLNTSSNLFEEICENNESNVGHNSFRHKRYAGRYQQSFSMRPIKEDICEDDNSDQNFTQRCIDNTQSIFSQRNLPSFRLDPGKKWRRSILIMRGFMDGNLDQTNNFTQNGNKGRNWNTTVDDVLRRQSIDSSMYEKLSQSIMVRDSTSRFSQTCSQANLSGISEEFARKYIFDTCGQSQPILFEEWFHQKSRRKWKKLGEGVYGEVFSYTLLKKNIVVKIIPIEGDTLINSERQKKLHEVYSEVLIATELNKLSDKNSWNQTSSFCKLKNISCVRGLYPEPLISRWTEYDSAKGSDNDCPSILPDDQMYMILEMEDGGSDLESYIFNSAHQSVYAFLQVLFGLAVAEEQYRFEHRDLHIGNILVKKIGSNRKISYKIDGDTYTILSQCVMVTIIDFTLSRMTYCNKPIFNDLSGDPELFISDGDYQFEIYRLMRKETNEQWDSFKPKTNIYWLHYVLDKMLSSVHYKYTTTMNHSSGINILQELKDSILSFDSAKSFVLSDIVLDLIR